MKVVEQFVDVRTGESGRRTVEHADVMTEAEGIEHDAKEHAAQAVQAKKAALREQMLHALLLGDDIPTQDRAEYRRLCSHEP